MEEVEELLHQPDSDLREERGSLVLSPFKADEKTLELKSLAEEITARLPRIEITDLLAGLKQKLSPNKATTGFVSCKYVPILVEPFNKTIRHGCTKCL